MLRFVFMTHEVYLLLGTNLGARLSHIDCARGHIATHIGTIISRSALYETSSWGSAEPQPDYINQVIRVHTTLEPTVLLATIHTIEQNLGRIRTFKWDSRVIDIDILFYDDQIVDLPDLHIPHPYFQERNFAMAPMNELVPDFIHPVLKKTIRDLYQQSADTLPVWLYKEADFNSMENYIGKDAAVQQSIITLFLEQTPADISKLSGYIQAEDWSNARLQAHRIKPTLTYMGAISLREALEELESLLKGQLAVSDKQFSENVGLKAKFQNIELRFELLFSELKTYLEALKWK